jgi:hypothetical protein
MGPVEVTSSLSQPRGVKARIARPTFCILGPAGKILVARRSPRWQRQENLGIAIGLGRHNRASLSTYRPQVSAWLPGRMPRGLPLQERAACTHKSDQGRGLNERGTLLGLSVLPSGLAHRNMSVSCRMPCVSEYVEYVEADEIACMSHSPTVSKRHRRAKLITSSYGKRCRPFLLRLP